MVTVALAGDFIATRALRPLTPALQQVSSILRRSDVAIANFEIALCEAGAPLEKPNVRYADPRAASTFGEIGFDILSVANNHTMDYGWPGLRSTIAALRDGGHAVIGGGPDAPAAAAPVILERGEARIGAIAFSCLTPAGSRATVDRGGIAAIRIHTSYEIDPLVQIEEPGDPAAVHVKTSPDPEDLRQGVDSVRALSTECDHVVVSLHWGYGSGEDLAEYQAKVARAFIEAGAAVIHGHHPHAIHAVGFHAGKPIFYSPGAFMAEQFHIPASPAVQKMRAGMSKDGYVALVELASGAAPAVRIFPTVLDESHRPSLAQGADFERISQRLQRLSAPHGALVRTDGDSLVAFPMNN
jgi:poly-gamma-glutamate synthesis protein (capsule biosynthesis protein)